MRRRFITEYRATLHSETTPFTQFAVNVRKEMPIFGLKKRTTELCNRDSGESVIAGQAGGANSSVGLLAL